MNEIMGISRLRIGTDGKGITTLVLFYGCPLKCAYCLNPQCHEKNTVKAEYTPKELYEKIMIDDIYFQMTGGGVTFGGGEPLLYSEFINQFCELANPAWKIRVETSLNVNWDSIEELLQYVDLWIVDIKDMDPKIYYAYTGNENSQVIDNLKRLRRAVEPERILIRVPLIPEYNTMIEIESSMALLKDFKNIDQFAYFI